MSKIVGVPVFHKAQYRVLFYLIFTTTTYFTSLNKTYVCNYADDTTLYAFNKYLNELLEHDSLLAGQYNYMKLNE